MITELHIITAEGFISYVVGQCGVTSIVERDIQTGSNSMVAFYFVYQGKNILSETSKNAPVHVVREKK